MSAADAIMDELARLCEEKGSIYFALTDAQRDRKYVSTRAETNAIHVAHGEHLGAMDSLYAARRILNACKAAQPVSQAEAVIEWTAARPLC